MLNLRAVERDQLMLMPPSLREWLPAGHLAWFILDVVAELDLSGFYGGMRSDGRGGASYDPGLMVGVLFYGYCIGERSSRRIERRLVEDVAFRVVAANQCPDHATLARFRRTHQEAIAGLFAQVLGLCAAGGLISSGVVAIDGTKIEADASGSQTRTRRRIAEEVLVEAEETDAAEDETFGDRRGDELPEPWIDSRDRRTRLREALRQLDADGPADPETHRAVREAKEAELGHKLPGRKPDPDARWGKKAKSRMANVTDPDSRVLKDRRRYMQGYNAQAAVTEDQMIVAAEMTNSARDSTIFRHMVTAAERNLTGAGAMRPEAFLADAGYWSGDNAGMECDAQILIAPMPATSDITDPDDPRLAERQAIIEQLDRAEISITEAAAQIGVSKTWARKLLANHRHGGQDPVQLRARMLERLHSPDGAAAFAKRGITVEPVFGNLKANLGYRRFSRRGFTAVASEWRLICTAHNLLKLHRQQPATG
jgi:transposase